MTFEQRSKGGEGVSIADIWDRVVQGKGKSAQSACCKRILPFMGNDRRANGSRGVVEM